MTYLDNAATTPLDPKVFEEMKPYLVEYYGNPSSAHSEGRVVKVAIEEARKKIAKILNTKPSEIYFNSGATEGNNTILRGAVERLGVECLISSKIEHHAVLHPVEELERNGALKVCWVRHHSDGSIDLKDLENLLAQNKKTLVSLMHANNELGIINPLESIAILCEKYGAFFHADAVQTVSHLRLDLSRIPIHFLTASAHKFHGPKGVGFLFMRKECRVVPLLRGGVQEKEFRAGTENTSGIIGMACALELSHKNLGSNERYLNDLKVNFIRQLTDHLPFLTENVEGTTKLSNIISLSVPSERAGPMLLFALDMAGIMVSGGSACSSGAVRSHVASILDSATDDVIIRISTSRFNTEADLLKLIEALTNTLV